MAKLPRLWLLDFDGPINDVVMSYVLTYVKILEELVGLKRGYALVVFWTTHQKYPLQYYKFPDYCANLHRQTILMGHTPKCTPKEMEAGWGKWPEIDDQVPYVSGVMEALGDLKSALAQVEGSIVIVSNRSAKSFEMHRTRLEGLVDHILIDDEKRNFPSKPDSAMLLKASEITGIGLDEAIFVGDGPNDSGAWVNAMEATNLKFPYYDVGNGYPGRKRDYPYSPIADLPTLIRKYLNGGKQ